VAIPVDVTGSIVIARKGRCYREYLHLAMRGGDRLQCDAAATCADRLLDESAIPINGK
jgi:hypothetical protein